MTHRRHILLPTLLCLLLTSCGAESILRKAEQNYALGEYNEAAALYKKAYAKTDPKEKATRG
ncbi:MAG: hypothetical protein IKJ92_10700, partial [Bacteroidaceae bacterium]|nr:hypothetical protein [Bacteroidaceae bacterium]